MKFKSIISVALITLSLSTFAQYSSTDKPEWCFDQVKSLDQINDASEGEGYPWLSVDGLRLYYTHGPSDDRHLMMAKRPTLNDDFDSSEIVPFNIEEAVGFWFTNDELNVYVCRQTDVFYAHRNSLSEPFDIPQPILLIDLPSGAQNYKGASVVPSGDVMYLYASGSDDERMILELTRNSPSSFIHSTTLEFPVDFIPAPGQLCKDGLTYVLSGARENTRASLFSITRKSLSEPFDMATFTEFHGISFDDYSVNQPTFSGNMESLAFVRSKSLWQFNDIFIAHNKNLTGPVDPASPVIISFAVTTFPVPADNHIYLDCDSPSGSNAELQIFSSRGELVEEFTHFSTEDRLAIDTSTWPGGIYFYKMQLNGSSSVATGKFTVLH